MADDGLATLPFDPRFPNQNQTRHCYVSYVDFYRCTKMKGEGYDACNYFKKAFESLCPKSWIEHWDTQRAENRFPGPL
ncbi:unnamed protein product [Notodromas monacha]|uniref:Cytochrome c oxidase subunit n=2 Tax=Notodromas monacha TaxID=399045 RepID=A0A7R9BS80_9CRUS|nr:unnamed protein product [Notodromas monacha]CAG0919812.1 unnamed protein product [Notodromas monacha]